MGRVVGDIELAGEHYRLVATPLVRQPPTNASYV